MLRIGDFSRLGRVTVITLRHYDQLGLLKPTQVDTYTGYRYYSASQLPRLNRILFLKDLGFNLEQIGQMLDENLTSEQIVGMLKLKRAEVAQNLAAEQARLAQLEARLRTIQHEDQLPAYEIVLKKIEAPPVLVVRDKIDAYADVSKLWRELKRYLKRAGIGWFYPNLAIWQEIEFLDKNIMAEAAIPAPAARSLPTNPRIQARTLPAVDTMACAMHQGDYGEFNWAYTALIRWNELNGFRVNGPIREVYLHYDKANPQMNVTEIQLPVEKSKEVQV